MSVLAAIFAYGLALWLGLYSICRNPRSPRLLLTGLGLVAYSLALACDLAATFAPTGFEPFLESLRWPLLLLPALLWSGALIHLLPDATPFRNRLSRAWSVAVIPVFALLLLSSFFTGLFSKPGTALALAAVVLAPMLSLACFVWWSLRGARGRRIVGPLAVVALLFALSALIVLFPFEFLPRSWALAALGADVAAFGLVVAYFDAFDEGESLLPDMARSFDAAFFSALVFGGQVGLVILFATGPAAPMLLLLLATVTTAVVIPTLADPLGAALDRLALGRAPGVIRIRSDLRATSRSLPRRDPELDPSTLGEEEFTRLTRRALSNFGNLPRLSASPLVNLDVVSARLEARDAPDAPLERAAELKSLLAESVARLKPRADAPFGTSGEWRHYNALHFPYVVDLKPYSSRLRTKPEDPATRQALEWFRADVPERTLHNWQNAAAKLVARDLLSRNESSAP